MIRWHSRWLAVYLSLCVIIGSLLGYLPFSRWVNGLLGLMVGYLLCKPLCRFSDWLLKKRSLAEFVCALFRHRPAACDFYLDYRGQITYYACRRCGEPLGDITVQLIAPAPVIPDDEIPW